MILLHTSDWHLGARLGRHERGSDQREALLGLLEIAQDVRPDLIVHAGDLFDVPRPPYEALRMGVQALNRLAEVAPTLVIRGNHDSSKLFEVINELAGAAGRDRLRMVVEPTVAEYPEIADQPVAVACVPFIRTGAIVDYASVQHERFEGTYADGIRTVNRRVLDKAEQAAGSDGIVLYAAHLHLHGARPGASERRLTVGEDYATHTDGLDRALYCAFGHIHDPQLLPGGTATGRYAGSLVPLDFGETKQAKVAVEVRIDDDGVQVESHRLPAGRRLRQFAGTLDELEDEAQDGGLNNVILKARVVSDEPIPNLADQLAEWSPECAVFNVVDDVANRRAKSISEAESDDGPEPPEDLFMEWRESAATKGQRTAPDERVRALFVQALGTVGQEEGADFGVGELAARAEKTLAALATGRPAGAGGATGSVGSRSGLPVTES